MRFANIHRVYFLGIGGIGMSALARYFNSKGLKVAGYDKVSTSLTSQLISEGIHIHFEDDPNLISPEFKNNENTLVVYTPALNPDHGELKFFRENNFRIEKRSTVLGAIVNEGTGIAVAGTHGKTTISGMIAHILRDSGTGCNAFLGGICKNFNSNFVLNPASDLFVVEADEYDRSFHTLYPHIAVITATDPDHLDIYEDCEKMKASFETFISQVQENGVLIIRKNVDLHISGKIKVLRYFVNEETDYYAYNIKRTGFNYSFSIHTPSGNFHDVRTGVFGKINIENAVAAFAASMEAGIEPGKIIEASASFMGIKRRFDIIIQTENIVFIDDYAHHPEELKAFISSVKDAFPGRRIIGIFQPHLFTRTRDFAEGFAESLSLMEDVILMDIYPAREKPLKGITSDMILQKLTNKGRRILCKLDELPGIIENIEPDVLLNMGAGDIDLAIEPLRKILEKRK